MTKESQNERTETSALSSMPAEFAAAGRKRFEDFTKAQTELIEKLRELNRQWIERVQSEANLVSEFASKLSAARSIPDAMSACQEWTSRRFEMMADDGKHLLADTQKFMETSARLLSKGWWSDRPGAGT